MRQLFMGALFVSLYAWAQSPELIRAQQELQRVEKLVHEGGLAKARIDQARDAIVEAQDQDMLRRTLYGSLSVQQLTEPLTLQMLESAQRLVAKQQEKIHKAEKLVELGVAPKTSVTELQDELAARRKTLELAEGRARLWTELTEMARAEQARQAAIEAEGAEEYEGSDNVLAPARLKLLEAAFQRRFQRELPVSAHGDTMFHRSLGLNHTGRIDIAVSPESPEGEWLRNWLGQSKVPFLAFKSAIAGRATGPHIHVGPPSSRLRVAD